MHKNFKKYFENERKIERRSFVTERERERKTAEKLSPSASGAQNFRKSAERERKRKQFFLSALKLWILGAIFFGTFWI